MAVICVGLNHTTAPVEIRERLAFSKGDLPSAVLDIAALEGLEEAVVLSTCNRMEIYGVEADDHDGRSLARIARYLSEKFELADSVPETLGLYELRKEEAVRHLFQVASGLDSMVLGETEIFGQIKAAYANALESGSTSRTLNKLFQQTFQVGKLVRSTTRIQRGSTSVGSVAVDLAEKIFGDLKKCKVMLLGAGETSRTTAMSLRSRGAGSIFVSNRSYDRAVELADEMSGEAVRFDDWPDEIQKVDIVISSTSAPHAILTLDHVQPVVRKRRGRPLFLIDIAVPRDIDPAVHDIEGVYLFDIDRLEELAAESRRKRQEQVEECDQLISAQMEKHGWTGPSGDPGKSRGSGESDPVPTS